MQKEFPLQFSSLSMSHCYKSPGHQVLCCKILSVVIYFKTTSRAGLFRKVSAINFSTAELPLTSLLKHKTYMTAGFHDYHVREYSVCGKSSVTLGRETIKKKKSQNVKGSSNDVFSHVFH